MSGCQRSRCLDNLLDFCAAQVDQPLEQLPEIVFNLMAPNGPWISARGPEIASRRRPISSLGRKPTSPSNGVMANTISQPHDRRIPLAPFGRELSEPVLGRLLGRRTLWAFHRMNHEGPPVGFGSASEA